MLPGVPPDIARDGVLHTWRAYSGTLNHCILDLDLGAAARRAAGSGLPVRLLHGGSDREAPPDAILPLVRAPAWELELVPEADHGLPIERPRRTAEAIRTIAILAGEGEGRACWGAGVTTPFSQDV